MNVRPEILLVEDEPVIAMMIDSVLSASGFKIVGPFETVAAGSTAAERFDGCGALIDLRLQGDDAHVVAEILERRSVPFIVMTGDDTSDYPAARGVPILKKPFATAKLIDSVREICRPSPQWPNPLWPQSALG